MERDGRIWRTGGRERVSRGTEKEGGRERERRCRIKGNDTCATVCRPDVRCFVTITYMPVFYIYAGRISARLQYLANAQTPRRNRARMWLGARHRVGIGHRDDSKGAEPRVPAFVNASLYAGAGNDVLIDSLPPSTDVGREPPHRPSARIEKRHFHSLELLADWDWFRNVRITAQVYRGLVNGDYGRAGSQGGEASAQGSVDQRWKISPFFAARFAFTRFRDGNEVAKIIERLDTRKLLSFLSDWKRKKEENNIRRRVKFLLRVTSLWNIVFERGREQIFIINIRQS